MFTPKSIYSLITHIIMELNIFYKDFQFINFTDTWEGVIHLLKKTKLTLSLLKSITNFKI